MRTERQDEIWKMLDAVIKAYGGSIMDYSCGKSWDAGQAVCRHMFGPTWSKTDAFKQLDALPEVPYEYVEAGYDMVNSRPHWMTPETEEAA